VTCPLRGGGEVVSEEGRKTTPSFERENSDIQKRPTLLSTPGKYEKGHIDHKFRGHKGEIFLHQRGCNGHRG